MNVQGSVHWDEVYSVGECKFFYLIIKIERSETTKSHMFNMSVTC